MIGHTDNQPLPIGGMIEEFRIVGVLGTGSFGVVYQAANTYLDETVAIKEFLPTDLARRMPDGHIEPLSAATTEAFEWALERFLREAKTLWGLARPQRHPSIVRVTRFRELNGSAYMFMEFEHGKSFADVLEERGAPSYAELRDIVESLLSGLARVHEGGILHRDIKPANVLIRSDGLPVLIDFGSARYLSRANERSVFATYTPLYAAIEQHQEVGNEGPWTDIYGLGATLYRAATGMAPKSASQRLLSDPQRPAVDVCRGRFPAAFLAAIDHACALEPSKRPQSVDEWRDELFGDGGVGDAFAPTIVKPIVGRGGAAADAATQSTGRVLGDGRDETRLSSSGAREPSARPASVKRLRLLPVIVGGVLALGIAAGGGWYLLNRSGGGDAGAELGLALPAAKPGRAPTAGTYERLALQHFKRNEIERSIELVELGLGSAPGDARLSRLRDYLAARKAAQQTLERATEAASSGDLERSLALIDEGLRQVPDHAGLRDLRRRVIEQRQARVADILEQARDRQRAGDIEKSAELVEQGLRLQPDDQELLELRSELSTERRRRAEIASAIEEVHGLLASGDLQAAGARLANALALNPDDPDLEQLGQALRAREKSRDEQQIADLQARARQALERGDPRAGLALIDGASASQREAPMLRTLRGQIVQAIDRRRADRLLDEAVASKKRGELDDSLRLIAEGLTLVPDDSRLTALRDEIESQRDKRARDERSVERLLERARQRRQSGDLDRAMTLVNHGLGVMPDDERLVALRDELQSAIDERDALAAILSSCERTLAGERLTVEQLRQAGACFQQALSRSPDQPRARGGLSRVLKRLARGADLAVQRRNLEGLDDAVAALAQLQPDYPDLEALRRDRELLRRGLLPDLVGIDAGCYRMGSPEDEAGRESDEHAHEVCVDGFLLARQEVTVADFRRFVDATGYVTDAERGVGGQDGCWALDRDNGGKKWQYFGWAQWRRPNKYQKQVDEHPVSCVSWNDATAYIEWLNDETGRDYRLPTEAEWEHAARAGTKSARYWLDQGETNACRYASVADTAHGWDDGFDCADGNEWVATVSSFGANPWGLNDMLGNLWEWTCSDYDEDYAGNERQCAFAGSLAPRVLRGGAWNSGPSAVRAAYRNRIYPEARYSFVGFRLAQGLPSNGAEAADASSSAQPQGVTRSEAMSSSRRP